MLIRTLILALVSLGLAAPAAHAETLGDLYVPDYDAADGVTVGHAGDIPYLHFGPKAAKLWKTIGGRKATVGCGTVTVKDLGDGFGTTGFGSSEIKLPARRTRVFLYDGGSGELCVIATKRSKRESQCLPMSAPDDKLCIRVVVAMTDSGRAYIDAKKRAIELFVAPTLQSFATGEDGAKVRKFLDRYVVTLPDPDAAPPAGKIGAWTQGEDAVYSSLLADGKRAFWSMRGGVYSTNLADLMGPREDAFSIF
ncbi:hypothetical protein [Solirubrobacter soli]|uniref:hypothetical protein n=1 Tax=Solirubrobacter soli TaxID=363832 RepID=UPI00040B3279|nr:hypothetical protein [Solirubrobacter soli]